MIQIKNYKPLLLLKEGGSVTDSNARWGIVVQNMPFKLVPDVKEYAKTDWKDADGDDEFIPAVPRFKAYEMEVSFLCVAPCGEANARIRAFWDFVKAGEMMMHDTYTGIGRRGVRFAKFAPKALRRRDGGTDAVEFKMTFKVNDPVTQIDLRRESLTVRGQFKTFQPVTLDGLHYLTAQKSLEPWSGEEGSNHLFFTSVTGDGGAVSGGTEGLNIVNNQTEMLLHTCQGGRLSLGVVQQVSPTLPPKLLFLDPKLENVGQKEGYPIPYGTIGTIEIDCPADSVRIACTGPYTLAGLRFVPDYRVR